MLPFAIILAIGVLVFALKAYANQNENTDENATTDATQNATTDANSQDDSDSDNEVPILNTIQPFLDVIAYAEGADYNTLVGGGTFTDFSDHPANLGWNGIQIKSPTLGKTVKTTGAGRYQITQTTFENYKEKFEIYDFEPQSQDDFATELIKMHGAYDDALNGNFLSAMKKCKNEWESFNLMIQNRYPKTLAQAQETFINSGGIIA
jgi:muramidase (phage lysozyme)